MKQYATTQRRREREREFTPFQPHRADAGAARPSPGRYHNRVFNHCVEQQNDNRGHSGSIDTTQLSACPHVPPLRPSWPQRRASGSRVRSCARPPPPHQPPSPLPPPTPPLLPATARVQAPETVRGAARRRGAGVSLPQAEVELLGVTLLRGLGLRHARVAAGAAARAAGTAPARVPGVPGRCVRPRGGTAGLAGLARRPAPGG